MIDLDTARASFFTAFQSIWNNRTPVAWQNATSNTAPPADGSEWIRATLIHTTGGQNTLGPADGAQEHRATGTIFVNIFVPLNAGVLRADELAREAYDALIGMPGGLIMRNQRVNETGATDDGWFQVDVLADFYYDFVR